MTQQGAPRPDGAFQPQPSPAERLLGQIKAQPLASAATGLLICVLFVLVLRAAWRPRPASAEVTNLLPLQAAASRTALVLPAVDDMPWGPIPALPSIPLRGAAGLPLPRNIFAVDLRRFPKVGGKAAEGRVEVDQGDGAGTAEVRLAELKRQVAAFRLEGTVTGPARAAFIDGTSVHEGDEYRGFRVTRIFSQGVQLERDGVRLELRMPEY
jgi:hypothetical protein